MFYILATVRSVRALKNLCPICVMHVFLIGSSSAFEVALIFLTDRICSFSFKKETIKNSYMNSVCFLALHKIVLPHKIE